MHERMKDIVAKTFTTMHLVSFTTDAHYDIKEWLWLFGHDCALGRH